MKNRLNRHYRFLVLGLAVVLTGLISPAARADDSGTLKWTFSASSAIDGAAARISDGTVYIGSNESKLIAIDSEGELKWQYTTGDSLVSSPAVGADGTIYVGSGDNYLYAINPDGSLKWRFGTGGDVSDPVIGSDGTIYARSDSSTLYAVEDKEDSGEEKWSLAIDGGASPSLALGPNGTLYLGTINGGLYAVNSSNGKSKWECCADGTDQIGGPVSSSPAIDWDGTSYIIYIGCDDGLVYAVKDNDDSGSIEWSRKIGDTIESSPVLGVNGTVYIGSDDNNLYALDGTTGDVEWTFPTDGDVSGAPAVDSSSNVYVASTDGTLYAMNSSGTQSWSYSIGQSLASPLIDPDGTIIIGTRDGDVHAVYGDSQGPADSDWPMFHHDMRRTGRNSSNQGPSADAGEDQNADEDATVTLNGTGSTDPDYGIVSYDWDQTDGPSVELSDESAISPTFSAPDYDEEDNIVKFRLTVKDTEGLSSTDTVEITIEESDSWCFIGTVTVR